MKLYSICGLFLILLSSPCFAGSNEEPVNYCKDPASWKEWNELLKKHPQDDAIYALYATRRGLCTMVESRMIDLNRATRIFEDIRESLVENYRDQSGPKEKNQAL